MSMIMAVRSRAALKGTATKTAPA